MNQFKPAQVIILPTENKINGSIVKDIKEVIKLLRIKKEGFCEHEDFIAQNLYIISNDEIKERHLLNTNNYYYIKNHYNEGYIGKFNGVSFDFINNQGNFNSNLFTCKKIIATTDTSIAYVKDTLSIVQCKNLTNHYPTEKWILPQPSQQFITKYTEEYNKGNIITNILVEYEIDKVKQLHIDSNSLNAGESLNNVIHYKTKINQNNTINIKLPKDSWNKEELIKEFLKCNHDLKIMKASKIRKWIEDNL